MTEKRIITAALTGAYSPKLVNPNVPVTPEEIAEDAYRCWKAGAAVVHLHMRDHRDQGSSDLDRFRETQRLIRTRCDLVISMSTSGSPEVNCADQEDALVERVAPISLSPEMCSLIGGPINWMSASPWAFQNTPRYIELVIESCKQYGCKPEIRIFHPGMFGVIQWYVERGRLDEDCHFQYVLGVQGGLPAVPYSVCELEHYRKELFPRSTWSGFGMSKGNLSCLYTCLALGGGIRVGLEDTSFYARGVVADNEMLVRRAARLISELGCEPATPDDAREMLNLHR